MTTTQYVGGAIGLALLVLLHGPAPVTDDFQRAFLVTVAMLLARAATLAGAGAGSRRHD